MKITLNKFQKAVRNVQRWAVTCGALPFGLMAFVHCSQPKLSKLVLPLDSPSTRMRLSINLTLNPWLVCLPDKWACISILLCFCACVIYLSWGLWSPNGAQHEETPPHCHLEHPIWLLIWITRSKMTNLQMYYVCDLCMCIFQRPWSSKEGLALALSFACSSDASLRVSGKGIVACMYLCVLFVCNTSDGLGSFRVTGLWFCCQDKQLRSCLGQVFHSDCRHSEISQINRPPLCIFVCLIVCVNCCLGVFLLLYLMTSLLS